MAWVWTMAALEKSVSGERRPVSQAGSLCWELLPKTNPNEPQTELSPASLSR